jgi:hypothetical protein
MAERNFLQAEIDLVAAFIALSPRSRRQIAIQASIATANLASWLRDGTRLSHESVARLGKEIGLVVEPGYVEPRGYFLKFCKGIDVPSLIVKNNPRSISLWKLVSKRLKGFDAIFSKVYKSKGEYSYIYLFYQGRQKLEQPDQMKAVRVETDFELTLPNTCNCSEWTSEDFDRISSMQMDSLWALPKRTQEIHVEPNTDLTSSSDMPSAGCADNLFEKQFFAWTTLIIDLQRKGFTPEAVRKELLDLQGKPV